ncbi:hypothetical protein [Vagococcus silagei]
MKRKFLIGYLSLCLVAPLISTPLVYAEEVNSTDTSMPSEETTTSSETKIVETENTTEKVETKTEIEKKESAAEDIQDEKYIAIIKKDEPVWKDAELTEKQGSTTDLYHQVYRVKQKITLSENQIILALYNHEEQLIGYVDETVTQESGIGGLWQSTRKFVSVISEEGAILNDLSGSVRRPTKDVLHQTYEARGYYNHFDGHVYYSLYTVNGAWQGYVSEQLVEETGSAQGSWRPDSRIVKVQGTSYATYNNFNWHVKHSGAQVKDKVYQVRGCYKHADGNTYYSLYDHQGSWQGYIDSRGVEETTDGQGPWRAKKSYLTIKNSEAKLYQGFNWTVRQTAENLMDQTLQVNGYYNHLNGNTYYSIYNLDGAWQGYIDEKDVELTAPQGAYHAMKETVTVKKGNHPIYGNFNWWVKSRSSQLEGKVLEARGYYRHINGSTYYTIYDSRGSWQGYIDEKHVQKMEPQGPWISKKGYIQIKKGTAELYQGFSWAVRQTGEGLLGQTLVVNGQYHHINSNTYYSVYNQDGAWQGYINKNEVDEVGAQGPWMGTNKYITIRNGNYLIYNNFNWSVRKKTSQVMDTTYQVKGYYKHLNGATYYSLYDGGGNWQGYINAGGVQEASGPEGVWLSDYRDVTISKGNYSFYNSFNWSVRGSSNSQLHKTVKLKGKYHHLNGSVYYSLYEPNGNWLGYINSGATAPTRSVSSFMGVSRQRLLGDLNSHLNDRYYLGTPYVGYMDPARSMSPNGAPTQYGPGFNCTGWVAYAVRKAGGDLNMITRVANDYGGVVNAYNWRDALKANTNYRTYDTISSLLASGQTKKGDLVYFESDFSKPVYDCHIGIFWGNTGRENKIWHSVAIGNSIGQLASYYGYSKIYVFPLD